MPGRLLEHLEPSVNLGFLEAKPPPAPREGPIGAPQARSSGWLSPTVLPGRVVSAQGTSPLEVLRVERVLAVGASVPCEQIPTGAFLAKAEAPTVPASPSVVRASGDRKTNPGCRCPELWVKVWASTKLVPIPSPDLVPPPGALTWCLPPSCFLSLGYSLSLSLPPAMMAAPSLPRPCDPLSSPGTPEMWVWARPAPPASHSFPAPDFSGLLGP